MDTKSVQFLIIGLVVGFIVGALAVDRGFILGGNPLEDELNGATTTPRDLGLPSAGTVSSSGASTDEDTTATSGIVLAGKNAVDAENQPAGSMVTLPLVVLNQMGWVVIHEDAGGKPGNALGATLVFAGERSGVLVELLRSTVKGRTYYAMLHNDDGDKVFDLKKDLPIADSTGAVIQISFVAE